jgi:chromosome segregation protein
MDQQFNAKQTLVTLEADIDLKNRELKKVTTELERLNTTRGTSFEQYDKQIKLKQNQIDGLQKEMERLEGEIKKSTELFHSLDGQIVAKQTEAARITSEANQQVLEIHNDAERREEAIGNKEANVKLREEQVKTNQEIVDKSLHEINLQKTRVAKARQELVTDKATFEAEKKQSEQAIAKAQELLDDINRQIREQSMQLSTINTSIDVQTKKADEIGKEANERLEKVKTREILVAGRERGVNEKRNELIKKEIWLDDREATVGRAYRETLERGGNIN